MQRVVVSGGGTGIGLAIAKRFAASGAEVYIIGRRKDVLDHAAASIDGGRIRPLVADLTSIEDLQQLADALSSAPVDILVNNAGGIPKGREPGLEGTVAHYRRTIESNLLTAMALTEALWSSLARPGGRVVNISSIAAQRGGGDAYAAAKSGLLGWAFGLAKKGGADNITVNTVSPGYIQDTEFFNAEGRSPRHDLLVSEVPLGGAVLNTGPQLIGLDLLAIPFGAIAVVAETGLTSHTAPERLANAEILVAASQSYAVTEDFGPSPPEREAIDAGLIGTVESVSGVEDAAVDVSHSARLDATGSSVEGHGWDTAALTGASLEGRAPDRSGEVVLDTATAEAAGRSSRRAGRCRRRGVAGAAGREEAAEDCHSPPPGPNPIAALRFSRAPAQSLVRVDAMREDTRVRIGLLGAFEVQGDDGTAVEVPGARLRGLLAALALEPGKTVPRTRLVDWVWGEESPADEVNALQVLVSRLRKVLPAGLVEAGSGGYRLAVEPEAVDVVRFERLVAQARDAADARRAELLREALGLWRGQPMEGIALLGSRPFDAVVAGLGERYLAVLGDRVDAEVRLGRAADLVSELTDLVARYPLREGFVGALMRALAESGRGAEALTEYQKLSERLGDELGVDPSAELSALHTALLRGEIGGRTEHRRTNLRAELTAFVGKEEATAAVAALAAKHRLTTLTGPGGSGKTRLAAETARTMLAGLPDGAWLVELAPLREESELAQAVLTALGLRESLLGGAAGGDAADRLVEAARDRVMLLVLDNCEHMIEAVSAFADRLLGESRRLRIIATSREPLGITGEALWQVAPLALPAADASPAEAAASPAVRLLRDRAEAVRRDIGADERALAAMARICRALDGMPLAIELAAARLRTMSVDQLADRLDDRFLLLTGGSRTAIPHHRTLRAVVDWSWDLLSGAERELLRRLSVFTGGVSLEAAERVCPDGENALDLLTALAEKSLLVPYGDGRPRYRMLNTIREYAAQRLEETGRAGDARRALLAHVTELAETADPHLRSAEQLEWLAALDAEHDNLTAALREAVADGRAADAQRLSGAAAWYWYLSGHRAEGTELAVAAASLEGDVPDLTRALACTAVTMFLTSGYGGDQYRAQEWIGEADRCARRSGATHPILGFAAPLARMLTEPQDFLPAFEPLIDGDDPWVSAQARLSRARMRLMLFRDETGVDADIETALAAFRAIGDRWGTSGALTFLADRLGAQGEFARACALYGDAAEALAEVGATEDVVGVRISQSHLYRMLGDEAAAAAAMDRAQRLADGIAWPGTVAELAFAKAQRARLRGDLAEARALLATVRARLGDELSGIRIATLDLLAYLAEDPAEARAHRAAAFEAAAAYGYPPMIAQALVGIADLALLQGNDGVAAQLVAAAEAVRGAPDRSQPDAARVTAEARERLGETGFAEAFRQGRERDWRELAESALAA